MKKAPKVLTRMRLSCCWGDNLNVEELNEIVDYINDLERYCKKQKEVIDRIDKYIKPLLTNRDDEQYYDINWYNKDVLLSMLKEVEE